MEIDRAKRNGTRVANPYGYDRAFKYVPNRDDWQWFTKSLDNELAANSVLDSTAGGGAIPFEAARLRLATVANDLNPVAALILKATIEWPLAHCIDIQSEFEALATRWRRELDVRLQGFFDQRALPDEVDITYLWSRTVVCPYCDGVVPLSPNWRLDPGGTGVKFTPELSSGPNTAGRICTFEVVETAQEQSPGTVSGGNGTCPYSDCGRVIHGDDIKRQAQAEGMGEQMFAVVYKKRVRASTKTGRGREKWVRKYRAPQPEDDKREEIRAVLDTRVPDWEALNIVPSERIPDGTKTAEPQRYGMMSWRDLFAPRQLLCHGTSVEVFREMLEVDETEKHLDDVKRAAYGYLALTIDTLLDYNNRASYWDTNTGRGVRHIFNRHDFAFVWSYAEMVPVVAGVGFDWAVKKTTKCIEELVALLNPGTDHQMGDLFRSDNTASFDSSKLTITCKPGDNLDHIEDASIDAIVIDPPYGTNVMYAELSDFFYVWLKRTAGQVFPELFRRQLTDKENEAVSNAAKFPGSKGAAVLADRDYQERMALIFAECQRVLKSDGIMTVMFTHKATGAWDALTKGLMEAGFVISASWPVNTESEGGLHIKNKAAAKSTVFLVCRPRARERTADEVAYWEDVEPRVVHAVRSRVKEFQEGGISGVDLLLASFGPALEEFSRHWPLRRGSPRKRPETLRRRRQRALFEEEWDPYEVTPEDALDTARREVRRERLSRLTHLSAGADLDPTTSFFVLAWDTFKAPMFSYDEALGLARAVGVDLEKEIVGKLAEKKSANLRVWDSAIRAAKGTLGAADGSRGMIDVLHQAANVGRRRSVAGAREMLEKARIADDPEFLAAFEAILEVLPPSTSVTGITLKGDIESAASDFKALYKLYRLAYTEKIDEPEQLKLWREEGA